MKQVNNLNELIDLVGEDVVTKCFAEYLLGAAVITAKAQRLDDLQQHIESLAKASNGKMPLRSGDLLAMLNAPLFVAVDKE